MKKIFVLLALLISSCAPTTREEQKKSYGETGVLPLYEAGLSVRIYAQKGVDGNGRVYETIVSVNMTTGEIHESSAHYLK